MASAFNENYMLMLDLAIRSLDVYIFCKTVEEGEEHVVLCVCVPSQHHRADRTVSVTS